MLFRSKKCLVLIVLALFVFAIPVLAGKVAQINITHPVIDLFQAYGVSEGEGADCILGYNGFGDATITAVPGVLCIDPGVNWANFINAPLDRDPDDTVFRLWNA